MSHLVGGWRRIGAVAAALVLTGALATVGPASPAAASPAAPASPSPQCSAWSEGWGWPEGSSINGSCVNGSSAWSYVIHGACTFHPGTGHAVTAGPALTTSNLSRWCAGGTGIIIQIAVYSGGSAPPHPDPNLDNLCFGGMCPY